MGYFIAVLVAILPGASMVVEEAQQTRARPSFWRKLTRGLAYMPLGLIPLVMLSVLAGGIGSAIGMLFVAGFFVIGFTGEQLFSTARAPDFDGAPSQLAQTSEAIAAGSAAPPRKRSGLLWKVPAGAIAAILVFGFLVSLNSPPEPSGGTATSAAEPEPVQPTSTTQAATATDTAAVEGKIRYFKQRPCGGIDDCTAANIAAEQTEASRNFNFMSRDAMGEAISKLGTPTFVLRSGDVVRTEFYERYPTEMRFADVIIGWANGHCAPNELHVTTRGGLTTPSPMPGGTSCMRDGSIYPLPPTKFLCSGGRKADALCKLAGVFKLTGGAPREAPASAALGVDQATALRRSPEQHGFATGYIMTGASACNGMFLGDVPSGAATAGTWMAARRRGEAAGKAAMAKGQRSFCDELAEKYGQTGSVMSGMFKKLGP